MKNFQLLKYLLLSFIFIILVSPLFAWSTINGIVISTTSYSHSSANIIPDGSSGAIITWQDGRSGWDIYAQKVNSSGNVLWTLNGLGVCTVTDSQVNPNLCTDGAGGAIFVWEDRRNGVVYQMYCQRVNAAGSPLWTANGVNLDNAINYRGNPQLISDGSGGAFVTWWDYSGTIYWAVSVQRVNSNGVPQWTANGVVINPSKKACLYAEPVLCSDGQGGIIVAWRAENSSGNYDLYAQRMNSNGSTLWTINGVAVCTAIHYNYHNSQTLPEIISDGNGGAIITWKDLRNGDYDIYAQRINSNGVAQWMLDGVTVCTATGSQTYPHIISDNNGGAIISWQDARNGNCDIYAQRIDSNGNALWTLDGVGVCTTFSDQTTPRIATDGLNGAIITWADSRNGDLDIYGQRINMDGIPYWTENGISLSTVTNTQRYPFVIYNNAGGAIVTWEDYRNGNNYDIYAQQVDSNGLIYVPQDVPKSVWEGYH